MSRDEGASHGTEPSNTAHAAHDIVNLVTIVVAYADHLSRRLHRDDPAQEDVREIRAAAQRAAGLARELLTFTRRPEPTEAVIDLHELFGSLEGWLHRIAGESVRVELCRGATQVGVLGRVGDLERLLINLALNARDAMPDGGVLTIATSDAGGPEGARRHVELVVRDTGVGMDDATRGRIFDPRFTTKGSSGGTGLGLDAVAGVVGSMGGTITVDSAMGRGTSFRILLPITR